MAALEGFKILSLAVNLPGPAAARRLLQHGARVVKVEPPGGDPMALYLPEFYNRLNAGQQIISLDLKSEQNRARLLEELADTDLLLTASRPEALERLGLGWETLHRRFPRLCRVAIVGYPPPDENLPGHDLTYQAKIGLIDPPQLPRTLIADMAGAERAASEALALLLARERGQGNSQAWVALSEAADQMAEPFRSGLTADGALLGGALAEYNLYRTGDRWVAVAALEPHFKKGLEKALGINVGSPDSLRPVFAEKTASEWETWAKNLDLPIVAVNEGYKQTVHKDKGA